MVVLDARELYRFFHSGEEEVKALRGVDLTLHAGEMIALVGPSGSGKSTLLACLAGLDEPDGGSVRIMGTMITRKPEVEKSRLRARHLGVMRQNDNLFSHLTVLENVGLARSVSPQNRLAPAEDVLVRTGLAARQDALPPQLSGGERARASLAVAMATHPEVLLLDEPTGEVDVDTEQAILEVLADYRSGGGAIVVATHNSAVARSAAMALTMRDGKICDD